jgi:predicted membrane channel-forming protein YqfA (hemolysin III family)
MTLAISIFILSVFEWMHRPEHKKFKAAIYGGFGLFNIIPITHLLINDFFFSEGDNFSFASSLHYYLLLGLSYLIGLYIYTVR